MKKIILIVSAVFVTLFSFGQETKKVTGSVLDEETKEGLPFVTIGVKGGTNGTSTDFDGKFSIDVKDSDTLIFLMVGYQKMEKPVAGQTTLDVSLKLTLLKEVVVVGYGTQEAEDVTGSVVRVDAEDVQKVAVAGAVDALQGRAAGVEVINNNGAPGPNASIRIRGVSSINGGAPISIVDGVFMDGAAINAIPPQDIESIDIIKDASAAAIYGARAANGVIIITTKKGKKGKVKVTYDSYIGTQSLIKKIDVMNAEQYAEAQNTVADNRGVARDLAFEFPSDFRGTGTDWQDALFQKGSLENHHIGISGGGEASTYSLSLDYYDEKGTVPYSFYKRYSIRNNMTFDVSKYVKAGINAGFTRDGGRQPASFGGTFMEGNMLLTAVGIDPTVEATRPYTTDPDTLTLVPEWHYLYKEGDSLAWNNTPRDNIRNPIAAISRGSERYGMTWTDKIIVNPYIEFTPVEWLKFRTSLGADYSIQNGWWYNPVYYIDGVDQNAPGNDSYGKSYQRWFSYNWNNTAEFTKMIGKHNVSVLGGSDAQEWNSNNFGWTQNDLGGSVNKDIEDHLLVSGLYADADPVNRNLWNGIDYWRFSSYFGRINYEFDDKYLLTINARRDGSSLFGSESRFGNFGGFSSGWKIHNEKFFKDLQEAGKLDFLTFAKIRAGYGKLGNTVPGFGTFAYNSRPSINNSVVVFGPDSPDNTRLWGSTIDFKDNPYLKWEEISMTNFATDLSFLNNKVWFTAEYYIRNSADMIMPNTITPVAYGFSGSAPFNIATMKSRGIDLSIDYKKWEGDFKYDLGLNFTRTRNEIVALNGQDKLFGYVFGGRYSETGIGQQMNDFYGYEVEGIFQTDADVDAVRTHTDANGTVHQNYTATVGAGDRKYKDQNGDGKLDDEDRVKIGSPTPDFTLGFKTNFEYKGFDLNIFMYLNYGNEIYNATKMYLETDEENSNYATYMLTDAWTPENTNSEIPMLGGDRVNNYSRPSDALIEDGTFLRFRTIQLGYTLPKSILNKAKIGSLRFYVSVQNHFTLTGYSGRDPELGEGRFDAANYPVPKTAMFGLNAKF